MLAVDRWYEPGEPPIEEWEVFGRDFVRLLIARNFNKAYQHLSEKLAKEMTVQELQTTFENLALDEDEPLGEGWVLSSISGWPDQDPDELGQCYVQIDGDYNEAITPVVARRDHGFCVTRIEWGRP
jgi:hypothetical protein